MAPRSIACFLCSDLERDPVAAHVFDALVALHAPESAGSVVDGADVLLARPRPGVEMLVVRTAEVVCHDHDRYLPIMKHIIETADAEAAIVVNWHAGANAPERILTAHSNGDVVAGAWARSDPRQVRNLLVSLEHEREREGLSDFGVVVEATHWSGTQYGCAAARVEEYPVPLYDLEIGSERESWSDPRAARVLARAAGHVLDDGGEVVSAICGGGVHCERGFSDPVLSSPGDHELAISHILPNHWLVAGGYDDPDSADARLDACVASIAGGIGLVAVHDKLKSAYKDAFRRLAERNVVPIVRHKALRRPLELA